MVRGMVRQSGASEEEVNTARLGGKESKYAHSNHGGGKQLRRDNRHQSKVKEVEKESSQRDAPPTGIDIYTALAEPTAPAKLFIKTGPPKEGTKVEEGGLFVRKRSKHWRFSKSRTRSRQKSGTSDGNGNKTEQDGQLESPTKTVMGISQKDMEEEGDGGDDQNVLKPSTPPKRYDAEEAAEEKNLITSEARTNQQETNASTSKIPLFKQTLSANPSHVEVFFDHDPKRPTETVKYIQSPTENAKQTVVRTRSAYHIRLSPEVLTGIIVSGKKAKHSLLSGDTKQMPPDHAVAYIKLLPSTVITVAMDKSDTLMSLPLPSTMTKKDEAKGENCVRWDTDRQLNSLCFTAFVENEMSNLTGKGRVLDDIKLEVGLKYDEKTIPQGSVSLSLPLENTLDSMHDLKVIVSSKGLSKKSGWAKLKKSHRNRTPHELDSDSVLKVKIDIKASDNKDQCPQFWDEMQNGNLLDLDRKDTVMITGSGVETTIAEPEPELYSAFITSICCLGSNRATTEHDMAEVKESLSQASGLDCPRNNFCCTTDQITSKSEPVDQSPELKSRSESEDLSSGKMSPPCDPCDEAAVENTFFNFLGSEHHSKTQQVAVGKKIGVNIKDCKIETYDVEPNTTGDEVLTPRVDNSTKAECIVADGKDKDDSDLAVKHVQAAEEGTPTKNSTPSVGVESETMRENALTSDETNLKNKGTFTTFASGNTDTKNALFFISCCGDDNACEDEYTFRSDQDSMGGTTHASSFTSVPFPMWTRLTKPASSLSKNTADLALEDSCDETKLESRKSPLLPSYSEESKSNIEETLHQKTINSLREDSIEADESSRNTKADLYDCQACYVSLFSTCCGDEHVDTIRSSKDEEESKATNFGQESFSSENNATMVPTVEVNYCEKEDNKVGSPEDVVDVFSWRFKEMPRNVTKRSHRLSFPIRKRSTQKSFHAASNQVGLESKKTRDALGIERARVCDKKVDVVSRESATKQAVCMKKSDKSPTAIAISDLGDELRVKTLNNKSDKKESNLDEDLGEYSPPTSARNAALAKTVTKSTCGENQQEAMKNSKLTPLMETIPKATNVPEFWAKTTKVDAKTTKVDQLFVKRNTSIKTVPTVMPSSRRPLDAAPVSSRVRVSNAKINQAPRPQKGPVQDAVPPVSKSKCRDEAPRQCDPAQAKKYSVSEFRQRRARKSTKQKHKKKQAKVIEMFPLVDPEVSKSFDEDGTSVYSSMYDIGENGTNISLGFGCSPFFNFDNHSAVTKAPSVVSSSDSTSEEELS